MYLLVIHEFSHLTAGCKFDWGRLQNPFLSIGEEACPGSFSPSDPQSAEDAEVVGIGRAETAIGLIHEFGNLCRPEPTL